MQMLTALKDSVLEMHTDKPPNSRFNVTKDTKMKLTYFPLTGRGEFIRLIFAAVSLIANIFLL